MESNKNEQYIIELVSLIKDTRKERKISQTEMAEKLGIGTNTYKNIETGQTSLKFNILLDIVDILGIDLAQLVRNQTEETSIAIKEMDFNDFLSLYVQKAKMQDEKINSLENKLDKILSLLEKNQNDE